MSFRSKGEIKTFSDKGQVKNIQSSLSIHRILVPGPPVYTKISTSSNLAISPAEPTYRKNWPSIFEDLASHRYCIFDPHLVEKNWSVRGPVQFISCCSSISCSCQQTYSRRNTERCFSILDTFPDVRGKFESSETKEEHQNGKQLLNRKYFLFSLLFYKVHSLV